MAATKICPMCHATNQDDRRVCRDCQYAFGQPPAVVRTLLRRHIRGAKTGFAVMVLVDILALGGLLFLALTGFPILIIGLITIPLTVTIRLFNKLLMWRTSLKAIDHQFPELPEARLLD